MFCRNCVLLMVAAAAAAWINTVQATPISVPDGDFETPYIGMGDSNSYTIDGTPGSLTPWNGFGYIRDPLTSTFPQPTGVLPSPANGYNAAFVIAQSTYSGYIWQQVGTMQAGTTYTVTVAVGAVLDTTYPDGQWWIDLGKGSRLNTSFGYGEVTSLNPTNPNPTPGTFVNETCSYTATAADQGQALNIILSGGEYVPSGSTMNVTYFDNVRLDGTAVPEPGTLVLLATGLLGLLAYAWRKRKCVPS